MRKHAAYLIKKTVEKFHRISGTRSLSFPDGLTRNQITSMKILGNYTLGSDGLFVGVGDYRSATDNYLITLTVKNQNSENLATINIYIKNSLLRLGSIMDELDAINKTITRKTHTAKLGSGASVEESEFEDIYKIYLPKPIANKKIFIGTYERKSLSELKNSSSGFAAGEDGSFIYVKNTSLYTSLASLTSSIESSPLVIIYILKNYEYETVRLNLPSTGIYGKIEITSSVAPRNFYVEYPI